MIYSFQAAKLIIFFGIRKKKSKKVKKRYFIGFCFVGRKYGESCWIVARSFVKSIYISAEKKTLSGSPLYGERLRTKVLSTGRKTAFFEGGQDRKKSA